MAGAEQEGLWDSRHERAGVDRANASHGCIRMRNSDVEELFQLVAVGDTVELVGERTAETERIFGAVTLVASASHE